MGKYLYEAKEGRWVFKKQTGILYMAWLEKAWA